MKAIPRSRAPRSDRRSRGRWTTIVAKPSAFSSQHGLLLFQTEASFARGGRVRLAFRDLGRPRGRPIAVNRCDVEQKQV